MYCQNCGNKLKNGINICNKCGFENKIKLKNKFRSILIVSLLVLIITSLFFLYTNKKYKQNFLYYIGFEKNSFCEFEIINIREYRLGPNKDNVNLWYQNYISENNFPDIKSIYYNMWQFELNKRTIYHEAVIKNTSDRSQKLISVNTKLLDKENIIIAERSTNPLNIEIGPNQAIEFKTEIDLDTKEKVEKYFKNENKDQKVNFYPWFESCVY